jgi:GDPmannose 4,6-dehydratase
MKKAFITGITGQDGSYLAEHLLDLGYSVYGITRRNSVVENQQSRIDPIKHKLHVYYGDLLDPVGLAKILKEVKPDEIYNLAAQSHVRISFDIPDFTLKTNGLAVLNLLDIVRENHKDSKFYQACSSEMFGSSVDDDGYQRETTKMTPVSPYGCSKVLAYNLMRNYRDSYNLHLTNGILFNHESPRRGSNFVTSKVIKTACEIKLGLKNKLVMGNLESYRDWGHSKDYVKAMHLICNHDKADDFVVATGETRSIRNLCEVVFSSLDLDYRDYVEIDKAYFRPQELKYLKGDNSKFSKTFKWQREYSFDSMMQEMINFWMKELSK